MLSRLHRRATITAAATAVIGAAAISPALAAAPTAVTSPPDLTLVSDDYGLLSGIVNPNGQPVVYHFEYGPTTTYGTSTPDTSAGNGKAEVPVDYSLEDLTPNTTYHYRLVVSGDSAQGSAYAAIGQVTGDDQSFTTAPALAISFAKKSTKLKGDKVAIKLKAVGPAGEAASGKLKLTAKFKTGKKKKAKTRTIANRRFHVKTGATKTIKATLTAAARKAIAKSGSLKATATAGTTTAKLTIKG